LKKEDGSLRSSCPLLSLIRLHEYFLRNLHASKSLQACTHVAMEGLLTPVSTSYKSSEKPVEDALYVYPSSLNLTIAIRYPHASHPATKHLILHCSSEYIRGFGSGFLTDFASLGPWLKVPSQMLQNRPSNLHPRRQRRWSC
jgi:hypothetical protein